MRREDHVLLTIVCVVLAPYNLAIRQHRLIVGEVQLDEERCLSTGQSWGIILEIKGHLSS